MQRASRRSRTVDFPKTTEGPKKIMRNSPNTCRSIGGSPYLLGTARVAVLHVYPEARCVLVVHGQAGETSLRMCTGLCGERFGEGAGVVEVLGVTAQSNLHVARAALSRAAVEGSGRSFPVSVGELRRIRARRLQRPDGKR